MLPRPRVTPQLNFKAKQVKELFSWQKETIYEPIFTCSLSKAEVRNIIDSPLNVDYFPLHSQSTKRAVKLVTEASSNVCGSERRDDFFIARIEHRKAVPSYDGKKDMIKMFD